MPTGGYPLLGNPTGENGTVPFFQWGHRIQFRVWPFNIHEFDHETATDWAQKEIAGGAIYREWVGENDEQLYIRGRIFPSRLGGLEDLELFDTCRRMGLAQLLVRGSNPGTILGWFVCEKLVRAHTALDGQGIGQQIAFEAVLVRVPAPRAETVIGNLQRTLG